MVWAMNVTLLTISGVEADEMGCLRQPSIGGDSQEILERRIEGPVFVH